MKVHLSEVTANSKGPLRAQEASSDERSSKRNVSDPMELLSHAGMFPPAEGRNVCTVNISREREMGKLITLQAAKGFSGANMIYTTVQKAHESH